MELKQLQYFMAICEELHFTRAAEKMGVSAPNVSQQIRRLEEELGVLLFDRVGKTIVLTEAGAILHEHGAAVFGHLQHASDAIADLKQMQGGSLSIGVLPGDADLMFNALLLNFHQTYPTISLSLLETMKVTEQVLDRSIDVGVTIGPVIDERLTSIPLFHEEFSLAVSMNDPLATESFIPLNRLHVLEDGHVPTRPSMPQADRPLLHGQRVYSAAAYGDDNVILSPPDGAERNWYLCSAEIATG